MRRRAAGIAPFTVMSCDNLPGNGHVTRNAVAGLAALIDPALARWVRDNVAFPNGMVDRITPATTERERALLEATYGIVDARPVFCEAFRQWVLEDQFPAGRPALEKVGVQFVDRRAAVRADEDPHPQRRPCGDRLSGGADGHPFRARGDGRSRWSAGSSRKLLDDEIIPIVPPVPDTDLHAYKALIERRFANPKIGDTIRRLCLDGSNRQPKFILPIGRRPRCSGACGIDGLALVSRVLVPLLLRRNRQRRARSSPTTRTGRVCRRAPARRAHDPAAWLGMRDIFGDLGRRRAISPRRFRARSSASGATARARRSPAISRSPPAPAYRSSRPRGS